MNRAPIIEKNICNSDNDKIINSLTTIRSLQCSFLNKAYIDIILRIPVFKS